MACKVASSMLPINMLTFARANALPGDPWVEAQRVNELGIDWPDGDPWPATRYEVSANQWKNHDDDAWPAVTTYPLSSSDGNSPVCPRLAGSPNYPGPYPYQAPGEPFFTVSRVYSASRITSAYSGMIESCDRIVGDMTGPDNGQYLVQGRVQGCQLAIGFACNDQFVDAFDTAAQIQKVDSATFEMERIADGATCANVRAHYGN